MNKALQHYIKQWNLSDPEPLAQTFTSDLYKVQVSGETAVLKILSEAGIKDEQAAAAVLQWYDGHGAIQLWRHDAGAQLLEYAEGGDLLELVKAGRDDEATGIIAGVLNTLHSASQAEFPPNLTPLLTRFQALFEKASDDRGQGATSLFVRAAAVARELLSDQGPAHVLHGDIHHENIRHAGRGWLAIDPKGLVGDRTYDAANALGNPPLMPELVQNRERLLRQAEIMATALNVDRRRLLSYVFAHSCLAACWCVEDKQDPEDALKMARIAETCIIPTASIGRYHPT